MYRLLKDSHIKTVPALPDKLQAQDLLSALRSLRLDPQHHPAYHHQRSPSGLHNGTIMDMTDNFSSEHSRRPPSHLHSPFDPGPTSPAQSSVISANFHQSPTRQDMSASDIPTSAPGSLPPVTYGPPFEFARPSQPKVIIDQTHHLPSDHATSPGVSLSSGFVGQEPWHSEGHHPLSPAEHSLQRNGRASGESPSRGFAVENGQRNDGNVHSWAWAGETGLGVGFYGLNNLLGARDPNAGMDWESIEQRGEIVVPHDSHAQHVHGKWHGTPLN